MKKELRCPQDEAREIFYGMSMDEWKTQYQTDASDAKATLKIL